MNRDKFISSIKSNIFHIATQSIIDGCFFLIDEANRFGVDDQRMQAYILATAYWETGKTMQPVRENGRGEGMAYGKKLKQDRTPYTLPDKIYYGRGYSQTTWYDNYLMLTHQSYAKQKGWDFLNNPELLLLPEPSAWATIHCMWHGYYTGASLLKYFHDGVCDWFNARRIINGLDQAAVIAGIAQHFYGALQIATAS